MTAPTNQMATSVTRKEPTPSLATDTSPLRTLCPARLTQECPASLSGVSGRRFWSCPDEWDGRSKMGSGSATHLLLDCLGNLLLPFLHGRRVAAFQKQARLGFRAGVA